ncbi:F-box/kelch-repeat protein At1g57790-like [Silene latifolia]|uniref:F-box/kelch-repeat protein At1g57790-like n=1 Tax=Silene latifolia TaxID=37657 RepID=UPI003D76AC1D
MPHQKANSPFPLFMFLSNTQGICELWDPCYQNNGSITKKLPYSLSIVSTIEFCKDGWLMLRSHEGYYLQYMNLFTGEKGKYPTKSLSSGLSSFAFSTCPTSPDCQTIGINCPDSYYLIICLLPGDDGWDKYELEFEDNDVDFYSNYKSSPKYHDGAFYFLGENGNLGVFKIMNGEWESHKGPLRKDDSLKLNECYIAELDGQLVYVFIQAFGSSIEVYSFDIKQEVWVELKSLGDYTLFVSAASSLSIPTKDSSMRNRIYLPKRIGNEMVFYSLDTGKYHTSSSKFSFENFCGMNSQSFCCWV